MLFKASLPRYDGSPFPSLREVSRLKRTSVSSFSEKKDSRKVMAVGFRKVIVCLLVFGVVVLVIQMFALSSLKVQNSSRLPWEEVGEGMDDSMSRDKVRNAVLLPKRATLGVKVL